MASAESTPPDEERRRGFGPIYEFPLVVTLVILQAVVIGKLVCYHPSIRSWPALLVYGVCFFASCLLFVLERYIVLGIVRLEKALWRSVYGPAVSPPGGRGRSFAPRKRRAFLWWTGLVAVSAVTVLLVFAVLLWWVMGPWLEQDVLASLRTRGGHSINIYAGPFIDGDGPPLYAEVVYKGKVIAERNFFGVPAEDVAAGSLRFKLIEANDTGIVGVVEERKPTKLVMLFDFGEGLHWPAVFERFQQATPGVHYEGEDCQYMYRVGQEAEIRKEKARFRRILEEAGVTESGIREILGEED